MIMILVIDNYDSFTYNLVQYFGILGCDVETCRNDEISLDEVSERRPDYIVISPGPCTPKEAGMTLPIIKSFSGKIPILGVCLGHQSIAMAFGAKIVKSKFPIHGKVSKISHNDSGVFKNLPNPFVATRYHSLIVDPESLDNNFEITAWTGDLIMGLRHKTMGLEGVQFHPESILSESGFDLLKNFLNNYEKF